MAHKLNNAHLRDIADTVDPSGTTGAKMLNNEYLERIANGIGSITGIVDPGTGKIDSSMLEGVIDASNLPSYVDDVIEGYYHQGAFYSDSAHANAITGETGKIYVDVPSGATYRWGGSAYAKVGGSDVEIATTQDAVTGTNDTKVMTPLKTKQAIDASGVPEMSAAVRGGAKLDAYGGLALRDGALGVGSLVQESNGTVRGGIASLTAKGHAEQTTTTGKNLLDYSTVVVGKTWANSASVTNGTVQAAVTENTTYTLSLTCEYGVTKIYKSSSASGNNNIGSPTAIDGGGTFTTPSGCTYVAFQFTTQQDSSGQTVADPPNFAASMVSNIQLELGSTATEYEPYSGGVASPSPAWPQEIQVVRGRNLLGPLRQVTGVTVLGNSISFTGVNRDLFTGTTGADTSVADVSVLPHLGAGTYCLSYNKLDVVDLRISAVNDDGTINSVIIKQSKSGRQSYTFTLANPTYVTIRTSNTTVVDIQLELGSTPTPYVPYGHVGMEVRGRNLLDETLRNATYYTSDGDGIYNTSSGFAWSFANTCVRESLQAGTYTISAKLLFQEASGSTASMRVFTSDGTQLATATLASATHITFTLTSDATVGVAIKLTSGNCARFQLELGSVAHDYQPYFHSTTPIPLPSRGWVGSLPDGTADVLKLDGAGKVEWELADAETTTAATDGVTGTVGVDVLSTTGQIADGATVLFKLATPVTEQCAYVEDWPTDLPEGAVISIPELDAVNIKYFIDSSVMVLAKQWYARANSEYADRLEALESTVANLVAGA